MRAEDTPYGDPITPAQVGIGMLFDVTSDAVVVGNVLTGRVVLWNAAAEKMFGYSVQDAIGMRIEQLVPHDYRGRHRVGLLEFAKGGTSKLVDRSPVVVSALHADGTEFAVRLRLASLAPSGAAAPGVYVAAVITTTVA